MSYPGFTVTVRAPLPVGGAAIVGVGVVGAAVGAGVFAAAVGAADGAAVGTVVGAGVATAVGVAVGARVAAVGAAVLGAAVGTGVGAAVGAAVGGAVGTAVGTGMGAAVGVAVIGGTAGGADGGVMVGVDGGRMLMAGAAMAAGSVPVTRALKADVMAASLALFTAWKACRDWLELGSGASVRGQDNCDSQATQTQERFCKQLSVQFSCKVSDAMRRNGEEESLLTTTPDGTVQLSAQRHKRLIYAARVLKVDVKPYCATFNIS